MFLALYQSGKNEAICSSLLAQIESIHTIWNNQLFHIYKTATKTPTTLVQETVSGERLCFVYLLVVLIELVGTARKT